jgi:hypothetical protein
MVTTTESDSASQVLGAILVYIWSRVGVLWNFTSGGAANSSVTLVGLRATHAHRMFIRGMILEGRPNVTGRPTLAFLVIRRDPESVAEI